MGWHKSSSQAIRIKLGAKQDTEVSLLLALLLSTASLERPQQRQMLHTAHERAESKPRFPRASEVSSCNGSPVTLHRHLGVRAARDSVHSKHRHFLGFGNRMKI